MDLYGEMMERLPSKTLCLLTLFILLPLLTSCATTGRVRTSENSPPDTIEEGISVDTHGMADMGDIKERDEIYPSPGSPEGESIDVPDFMPVSEELLPLKTRDVSISARNTPLKDILHVIAETAALNLVIEKGVNPEVPVTMTLRNVNVEEALETLLSSLDYFYRIKNNILIIKAMDTRVFEFGRPSILQDYSVNIGGDILSSASSDEGITGSVTQKIKGDKNSFNLWDSIENTISNILGISKDAQATSEASQLRPSFNVNRMTGTVVVTATKYKLKQVDAYLKRLKDILNRQVMVEAKIVEVQLTDDLKYGIDWSFLGKVNGTGTLSTGVSGFTDVITAGLPDFNLNLTGGDFTFLLKALQQQGKVNVLSNPRVNIMNGQTALLSVGRKVDFISKVETTTTSSTTDTVPTLTFSVETSSVLSGIIFGIVPYIKSEEGEISMTITPIISDLVKLDEKTIGTSGNSTQISLPTVDLRELSTTVNVKDGEMIVIGGLINKSEKVDDNRVPLLSNMPIMGNLFRSRDKHNEKTELVIILQPRIVKVSENIQ